MKVYMSHQYCSFGANKEKEVTFRLKLRTVGETHGVNFSPFHVYFRAPLFVNDV